MTTTPQAPPPRAASPDFVGRGVPAPGVRLELDAMRIAWGHTVAIRDERDVLIDVPLLTPPEVKDPAHEPLFTYGLPGALARGWRRVRRWALGYTAADFARDRVRQTVPAGFRPLIDRLSLAQITQIGAAYTGFERVWVDDHTALAARLARRASGAARESEERERPAETLRRQLAVHNIGTPTPGGGLKV